MPEDYQHNKGVDRLVRALPGLSRKFKDLALVIVGSKWFSQDDVNGLYCLCTNINRQIDEFRCRNRVCLS